MIKLKDVTFKYNEKIVLDNINLEINQGEYISIIGSNGSGKSTLVKLLNSILKPIEGTIYVDDIETINSELLFQVRKNIGIVFQNPDNQIISSVVEEDVAFGPTNLELDNISEIVDKSLEEVSLSEKKYQLTNNLSGGEKQKLAMAGVLAMEPKCIIVDEATSMLDNNSRAAVLDVLRGLNEKGITVICITHNIEDTLESNRILVMNKGRIVLDNSPLNVFKNVSLLEEINLEVPIINKLACELGIDLKEVLDMDEFVDVLLGNMK